MRTDSGDADRNPRRRIPVPGTRAALAAILLLALGLRLWHIDFGLPALNDPDEPLFIMTAFDMLREQRLNPEWFGHPATLLLYALIGVIVLVGLAGFAIGWWSDAHELAAALFAQPELVVLPARLLMAACGMASIYLTYRIGRAVGGAAGGARVGLIAALLLACNALHVEFSQIVRTDMMATALMLLSTLYAVRIARDGRVRDHVLAGVAAGLACATKWPALLILANVAAATMACAVHDRRALRLLPLAPAVAVATLLIVSPFLVLDFATVLKDLGGEARPVHPGSTGTGFVGNLVWYARQPLGATLGVAGMVLAAAGIAIAPWRARLFACAALPGAVVVLAAIALQSLVWERWAVPLVPFAVLAIAIAIDAGARALSARHSGWIAALAAALLLPSMLGELVTRTRMRADDTRQVAARWVLATLPPGASILIEDAAFDLFARPGRLLFPMGSKGCIDIREALAGQPSYRDAGKAREGRALVDIGHVEPALLPGCRADFAILTHHARYLAEGGRFAAERANYAALMRGGRVVRVIAPIPGRRGGPIVHIVDLRAAAGAPQARAPQKSDGPGKPRAG